MGATTREGEDVILPQQAIYGPKVMIANEMSGSGGDALPWLFKKAGIGPLVGVRTWGGLVGIGGYPQLIDGGSVTAPRWALYGTNGRVGGREPRHRAGRRGGAGPGARAPGARPAARDARSRSRSRRSRRTRRRSSQRPAYPDYGPRLPKTREPVLEVAGNAKTLPKGKGP